MTLPPGAAPPHPLCSSSMASMSWGGQAHTTYGDGVEAYAEVLNEHYAMYTVR